MANSNPTTKLGHSTAWRTLAPNSATLARNWNTRSIGLPRPLAFIALITLSVLSVSCTQAESPAAKATESKTAESKAAKGEQLAILGTGCFWCTEAVYERMEGVNDVISGYIGGHVKNPTYQQVCGKKTGHAEAVQVYFDSSKTSFEELLSVFFKIHDPTTLNRQGADVGPQYRSTIFYQNDEQKKIAEKYIEKLNASGEFRSPIVTLLEPPAKFYVAEEYHQDYFRRNPNAGYCQAVVANKVRKFNRSFGEKIKEELK